MFFVEAISHHLYKWLNGMCGVLSEHCLGLKYTDDGIWPLQKTFIQMMRYIGGVMVSMLASSAVDHGFQPLILLLLH
jgi:hypothetical protein